MSATRHWHGTVSVPGPVDLNGCCEDQPDYRPVTPCPVNERRAGMTDQEFWEDVLSSLLGLNPFDAEEDYVAARALDLQDIPACPICGEPGACAYDAEGRPLIHSINEDGESEC